MKYKVTNINLNGSHYLIHVIYKDLSSRDVHAYDKIQLNEKVNILCNDDSVHDFYIYKGIDFDLEEIK